MKAGLFLLAACLLPAGAARGQAALSVRVSSQEVLVGDPVQVSVLLSGADAEPAGVPAFERPDAAPLVINRKQVKLVKDGKVKMSKQELEALGDLE